MDEAENIEQGVHQSKDPWEGVFLSFMVPGLGQVFAGEKKRGVLWLFLLWVGGLSGTGYFGWVFLSAERIISLIDAVSLGGMILAWFILEALMLVDAHRAVVRSNLRNDIPGPPTRPKKPWLGALLSYIFPGVGQFYNKQIFKGVVFVGIETILLFAENIYWVVFSFCFVFEIFSISDAYYVSTRTNGSAQSLLAQGTKRQVYTLMGVLFLFGFLTNTYNENIIKGRLIQPYNIPSASMSPTLREKDYILATKYGFSPQNTRRGDVIVFKYPVDKKTDYVKRVIGLPGEKIEIVDNKVYINGKSLDEAYTVYKGSEKYGPYTVPEGNYFVMGDNRDFSQDSRVWGPVPVDMIEGRVYKIYYPFSRSGPVE